MMHICVGLRWPLLSLLWFYLSLKIIYNQTSYIIFIIKPNSDNGGDYDDDDDDDNDDDERIIQFRITLRWRHMNVM